LLRRGRSGKIDAVVGTVARDLVAGILALAERAGIDTRAFEGLLVGERLDREQYHQMWRDLDARASRAGLALRLGAMVDPGRFGLLDFVVRNSPTLQQVLYDFSRYLPVLYSGPALSLTIGDDTASLSYIDARSPRPAAEWAVSVWKTLLTQLAGPECKPIWVRFQHPPPEDMTPYREAFHCQVDFGQPATALDFSTHYLGAINTSADARLYTLLSDFVARESERASAEENAGLAERLRRVVEAELASGRPNRDSIAARLHMSGSTLQRHLKKEGHGSFSDFLDSVRRDLALRYLRESSVTVGELALQLGFSDTSNFVRAFRKWTGMTPGQYRDDASAP